MGDGSSKELAGTVLLYCLYPGLDVLTCHLMIMRPWTGGL